MKNKRYEYDVESGTEKSERWLERAKKNRMGYIILFAIYVVVYAIIVMEVH